MMSAERLSVILVTCPPEDAKRIARVLVDETLVACVNVVSKIASIYRWEGAIEEGEESLLVLKTSKDRIPALEKRLIEIHPYDVPEILGLTPETVSEAYGRWVLSSVKTE
jgi:periplasmic divalent cation tolerance protein